MKSFFFFPTGYDDNISDIYNDNIDVNLVVYKETGMVYYYTTTLYTVKNIECLIEKENYFSVLDGIVIDNLSIEQISFIIKTIIQNEDFTSWILISESYKEFKENMNSYTIYYFN